MMAIVSSSWMEEAFLPKHPLRQAVPDAGGLGCFLRHTGLPVRGHHLGAHLSANCRALRADRSLFAALTSRIDRFGRPARRKATRTVSALTPSRRANSVCVVPAR